MDSEQMGHLVKLNKMIGLVKMTNNFLVKFDILC